MNEDAAATAVGCFIIIQGGIGYGKVARGHGHGDAAAVSCIIARDSGIGYGDGTAAIKDAAAKVCRTSRDGGISDGEGAGVIKAPTITSIS